MRDRHDSHERLALLGAYRVGLVGDEDSRDLREVFVVLVVRVVGEAFGRVGC